MPRFNPEPPADSSRRKRERLTVKLKWIIIGLGAAGCLGLLVLPRHSPPGGSPARPRPAGTAASRSIAAGNATVAPPEAQSAEPLAPGRGRRQVSRPEKERGRELRAKIQGFIASAHPSEQDVIFPSLSQWVALDAPAAARFAKSLPAGRWRGAIIRRVAQDWAGEDPASAQRWAARFKDADERASTLADVCLQVAQTDPRQAVAAAQRSGLGEGPGGVMDRLVQQWAAQDFAGADGWVMAQPADQRREGMLARLASVQSQTDPASAANLVAERMPAGPLQDEAAITVLDRWAARDLAAATAWADRFPAGGLRDRARQELRTFAGAR